MALVFFAVAAFGPAWADGGGPGEPAAWDGAERFAVIEMLGEPHKVKRRPGGVEVLTFKLVRMVPGSVPVAGERIIDIPRIGPCVTTTSRPDSSVKESTTFEPPSVDKHGRPVAGGTTTTQSRTVSWDRDDKRQDSEVSPSTASGAKVRLQLVFGADGRVADWSVSPKR